MFCSDVTKNSNWEKLTKNLVTFKRWDGVKYEKLKYFWGSRKNPIFKGHKKTIYRGIAKEGGLGQFADLRKGGLTRKKGMVFLKRSWYCNAHYAHFRSGWTLTFPSEIITQDAILPIFATTRFNYLLNKNLFFLHLFTWGYSKLFHCNWERLL